MVVLLRFKFVDRVIAAFTARETKPSKSGAQRTGQVAKIGGDLQGEPIFHLPGPASALACPLKKVA
jgi:hypothetical protein